MLIAKFLRKCPPITSASLLVVTLLVGSFAPALWIVWWESALAVHPPVFVVAAHFSLLWRSWPAGIIPVLTLLTYLRYRAEPRDDGPAAADARGTDYSKTAHMNNAQFWEWCARRRVGR